MELATRKKLAESLKGREVRSNPSAHLELRTDGDEIRATGYASVTNTPYDMGAYEEQISRGAFAKTLDEKPDVVLLLNHEGLPLSRTTNGTLTLREDERGLLFDAVLDPNDPQSTLVRSKIQSGHLSQCSFGFRVTRQSWDEDYTQRSINEVSLDRGDVSVVTYGASPTTSVQARSLAEYADLSDDEIRSLAEDPDELAQMQRIAAALSQIAVPEEEIREPVAPEIELYVARMQAIRLRGRAS